MMGLGVLPGGQRQSHGLAVSNDGSIVVGYSREPDEAFRWTSEGGMVGLGGVQGVPYDSAALDISADGAVIVGTGKIDDPNGSSVKVSVAFRWTANDEMVPLGHLPGDRFDGRANGVSADGSVIVGRSDTAFIWDAANGMRSVKEVLESTYGLDLTGWTLYTAEGISDDARTIVGRGVNPQGFVEGWIAIIPEPSTAALLALGLVGLAVARASD
jgi:uncharacterized membrane protein